MALLTVTYAAHNPPSRCLREWCVVLREGVSRCPHHSSPESWNSSSHCVTTTRHPLSYSRHSKGTRHTLQPAVMWPLYTACTWGLTWCGRAQPHGSGALSEELMKRILAASASSSISEWVTDQCGFWHTALKILTSTELGGLRVVTCKWLLVMLLISFGFRVYLFFLQLRLKPQVSSWYHFASSVSRQSLRMLICLQSK